MPSDDEAEDDEFDFGGEDGEDLDEDDDEMMDDDSEADEVDSAFASSDEGEMDVDETNDPRTAHLRLNPQPEGSDDEDGAITTNLEDDLTNEGFTLPAVERGGEVEDFEHGTSLREIETRMRWLVGVCAGKDEKLSEGVPGKYVTHTSRGEDADKADPGQITCCSLRTTSLRTSDTTFSSLES
jgi:ribosomal RNA methyltransferase Nop2